MKENNGFEPKRKRFNTVKSVFWYFFVMSLTFLAITNIVFFIYCFKKSSFTIAVDNISLILSVVGIIITFGSIYIYSIFYSNIDEEKERLNTLADSYENTLEQYRIRIDQTTILFDYSQKLIKFHQLCLLICNTERYNAQTSARIYEFQLIIDDYTKFLQDLYSKPNLSEVFNNMSCSFRDICRDSYDSFRVFKEFIKRNAEDFFKDIKDAIDIEAFINDLETIIIKLNKLQTDDFSKQDEILEHPEEQDDETSIKDAAIVLFKAIKKKFFP